MLAADSSNARRASRRDAALEQHHPEGLALLVREAKLAGHEPHLSHAAQCWRNRVSGDKAGSLKKLEGLLDYATQSLTAEGTVGFFTSRPTMIVFDDDPKVEAGIYCNYLIGLAHNGLDHQDEARKAFETVLNLDPHHWEARVELQEMEDKK